MSFSGAQRIKQGCFDAAPLSCKPLGSRLQVNEDELGYTLEDVCFRIVTELFPTGNAFFMFELTGHAEYINGVDASTEFCSQIQTAYSHCLFCDPAVEEQYQDIGFLHSCFSRVPNSPKCGGQLTKEQVQDISIVNYPGLQTDAQINATCAALENVKERPPLWPQMGTHLPSTIDLCVRLYFVQHLCPGNCDHDCFDPDLHPPTCYPQSSNESQLSELSDAEISQGCDIVSGAFSGDNMDTLLNVSGHQPYLTGIPNDIFLLEDKSIPPNASECHLARQAYPDCVWCAENLCFHDDYPASCDVPDFLESEVSQVDAQKACFDIYWAFGDIFGTDDIYNISKHTGHILIGEGTSQCEDARRAYHKCYWCVPGPTPHQFCGVDLGMSCINNLILPDSFRSVTLQDMDLPEASADRKCAEIHEYWKENPRSPFTIDGCFEEVYLSRLCPERFCDLDDAKVLNLNYLGTNSDGQRRALIWTSRVAAILSFIGASFILLDILPNPAKRSTVYHQLLVGMASFDLVTAVAWSFATAPIDAEEAGYVEGAMGNEATCICQGFFIQLGFTSIFYNVSLSLYFFLVVARNWREFQLKKIRLYMHVLPVLVGLGLSFGAIPSYQFLVYGCHLAPPPQGDLWAVLVFVVVPLGLSIASITATMVMLYCKVRTQSATSNKWSFGIGQANPMIRAVFWQCLFYTLAFYVTWPILFSVYVASVDEDGPFGLAMTVAFVAPLQGFSNCLVYIRPRLCKSGEYRQSSSTQSSSMRSSLFALAGFFTPSGRLSNSNRAMRLDLDPSVALALDDSVEESAEKEKDESSEEEKEEQEAQLDGDRKSVV